jgi:hypothetical protein
VFRFVTHVRSLEYIHNLWTQNILIGGKQRRTYAFEWVPSEVSAIGKLTSG